MKSAPGERGFANSSEKRWSSLKGLGEERGGEAMREGVVGVLSVGSDP